MDLGAKGLIISTICSLIFTIRAGDTVTFRDTVFDAIVLISKRRPPDKNTNKHIISIFSVASPRAAKQHLAGGFSASCKAALGCPFSCGFSESLQSSTWSAQPGIICTSVLES